VTLDSVSLVKAWRSGDRSAGQRLVTEHCRPLAEFLYSKVGDHAGREILQETLLTLCEKIDRYREGVPFSAFMFGIARLKLLEHFRATRRRSQYDEWSEEIPAVGLQADEHLQAKFAKNVVIKALRSLPLEQQMLLELHDHRRMTRRELAEIFDVAPGTIASRVARAREALQILAEQAQATPDDVASTSTTLASYWAEIGRRWEQTQTAFPPPPMPDSAADPSADPSLIGCGPTTRRSPSS